MINIDIQMIHFLHLVVFCVFLLLTGRFVHNDTVSTTKDDSELLANDLGAKCSIHSSIVCRS